MSLKNVSMARRLRGQGLTRRKGFLLEQIWLPGRLMEGLFPLSPPSCVMARLEFHSRAVKVDADPPPKRLYCAKVCSLSRAVCASLTSQPPHMVPLIFHPLASTHTAAASSQPLSLSSFILFKARPATGNNGAHAAPAINSRVPLCQIPQHLRDKQLSQKLTRK